ncbi:MAG: flagellar biosynthetic protein FliO [Deltaproteobacteria bacterium]|nr:flagellar biosynthetic protein FliO [Deltaproteobacteria bacterium]
MSTDFGIASIKMVGSLVLISCLIIGLFYLLRRFRWHSIGNQQNIRMYLLGLLQLAPKRAIALVQICDQWIVVGIGTETVTLITKIEPPTDISESEVSSAISKKSFHTILQDISLWPKSFTTRNHENLK